MALRNGQEMAQGREETEAQARKECIGRAIHTSVPRRSGGVEVDRPVQRQNTRVPLCLAWYHLCLERYCNCHGYQVDWACAHFSPPQACRPNSYCWKHRVKIRSEDFRALFVQVHMFDGTTKGRTP